MEHGQFIDRLPIKNGGSFHGYVSHSQMVNYNNTIIPLAPQAGLSRRTTTAGAAGAAAVAGSMAGAASRLGRMDIPLVQTLW